MESGSRDGTVVLDDNWVKHQLHEEKVKPDPDVAVCGITLAATEDSGKHVPPSESHDQDPDQFSTLSGCLKCRWGQFDSHGYTMTCCPHQILHCANGASEASGKGVRFLSETNLVRGMRHSLMEEIMEDYVSMSVDRRSVFCKRVPDIYRGLVCPACGYFVESGTDRLLLLVKHIRLHHPKNSEDLLEHSFQQYSRLFDFCLGALLKDRDIIGRHYFYAGVF